MKIMKIYRVEWMGLNFDDYPGFQPKITPAQRYATQSMYNRSLSLNLDFALARVGHLIV